MNAAVWPMVNIFYKNLQVWNLSKVLQGDAFDSAAVKKKPSSISCPDGKDFRGFIVATKSALVVHGVGVWLCTLMD